MRDIIVWIAVIFAIEAVVEIEVESVLFQGFRARLADIKGRFGWYLNGLFSCGYCLSVWVSILGAFVVPPIMTKYCVVDFIIRVFFLHRMSNILHELLKRWFDRIPIVLAFKPEDLSDGGYVEVPFDGNEGREKEEEGPGTSSDTGQARHERDGASGVAQEFRPSTGFPSQEDADGGVRDDQVSDGSQQET